MSKIIGSTTVTPYPQADWNQTDSTKADYIKNKPSIAITTETGSKVNVEIDNSTYKFKVKLYDKNDNLISTSDEIDLPLETMVVNGSYDSANKKVILTLKMVTPSIFPLAVLLRV